MKRGTRNKLEEVFIELDQANLLACPEIGDCSSCALNDINQLHYDRQESGKQTIGAVYCTSQDWEIAKETGELFVGFADFPDDDKEANLDLVKDIGLTVAAALQTKGFEVVWNGDPHTRIMLKVGGKKNGTVQSKADVVNKCPSNP